MHCPQPQPPISPYLPVPLNPTLQIRSLTPLHNRTQLAIQHMLQVSIISLQTMSTICQIKRISPPKHVISINDKYLCIHYSDNNCIIYDTTFFYPIYFVVGMFSDHKGLKSSLDGRYLLYGNDQAMQIWDVNAARILMLSHQFRSVAVYAIGSNGKEVYIGNFNGEINFVMIVKPQGSNITVPMGRLVKVHQKCVIGIEVIVGKYTLVSIDYGLQVVITSTISLKPERLLKISPQSNIPLSKPIGYKYSSIENSVYVNYNEQYYKIDLKGIVYRIYSNAIDTKTNNCNQNNENNENNERKLKMRGFVNAWDFVWGWGSEQGFMEMYII